MTKQEFMGLVNLIRAYYPREMFLQTEQAAMAWYEALSDLDAKKAENGIKKYVRDHKWPPTIAEIRTCAKGAWSMTDEEFAALAAAHEGADEW